MLLPGCEKDFGQQDIHLIRMYAHIWDANSEERFDCIDKLSDLDNLGVTRLEISDMSGSIDASDLPRTLTHLELGRIIFEGQLTNLAALPASLKTLCLTNLPFDLNFLPAGLETLTIIDDELTELPTLPRGLRDIMLVGCRSLTSIDSLVDLPLLTRIAIRFCPNVVDIPEPLQERVENEKAIHALMLRRHERDEAMSAREISQGFRIILHHEIHTIPSEDAKRIPVYASRPTPDPNVRLIPEYMAKPVSRRGRRGRYERR